MKRDFLFSIPFIKYGWLGWIAWVACLHSIGVFFSYDLDGMGILEGLENSKWMWDETGWNERRGDGLELCIHISENIFSNKKEGERIHTYIHNIYIHKNRETIRIQDRNSKNTFIIHLSSAYHYLIIRMCISIKKPRKKNVCFSVVWKMDDMMLNREDIPTYSLGWIFHGYVCNIYPSTFVHCKIQASRREITTV